MKNVFNSFLNITRPPENYIDEVNTEQQKRETSDCESGIVVFDDMLTCYVITKKPLILSSPEGPHSILDL